MKLPTIEIIFKQLASTLIARSQRGIAVLIVRDDTDNTFATRTYRSQRDLLEDRERYTAANYQQLVDAMSFTPYKLIAVRIGADGAMADALKVVEKTVKTGWVSIVGEAADETALIQWVKDWRTKGRTYKGLIAGTATPNDKYVVHFGNAKVTFADDRGEQEGVQYLPSLLGILAACNIERGVTNFVCENLLSALEPDDVDAALNAGKLVLMNDFDDVRIPLGINSMTTATGSDTEDMKYIDIVEAMDLIEDDIRETFKKTYQGAYKNSLDNQMLFISAVNTYFDALELQEVLDPDYNNRSDIDVSAQRAAWAQEKPEADFWEDAQVRNTPYKRSVFLAGDVKILGAMENLKFTISMF